MSTHEDTTAFEQWEVVELAAPAGEAPPPAADAEAELAGLREAARAEGYAEGLAAGRLEGEQACGRMKQLAESFSSTLDNLDFRLADMVLELALDVARQVVAGELAAHPERILDVVNLALKQMAETSREARLLLNPDDAALVRPASRPGARQEPPAHRGRRAHRARRLPDRNLAGRPRRHPAGALAPGGAGARFQPELGRIILGTPVDRSRHAIVIILFP